MTADPPVLCLADVTVRLPDGQVLVDSIDWAVRPGEHWVLLGANGAGKSTLLSVAGGVRHPTTGAVELLGARFGHTDLRELRSRVGVVDHALRIPAGLPAADVVLTGATGSVQLVAGRYSAQQVDRARHLLDLLGCPHLADRPTGTWSHGERARVRLARALMPAPPLLLLDEPASGLDLPGREDLVAALAALAKADRRLATVLVTHHLEEVPATTTHALLLRGGRAVAAGPAADVLTSAEVSGCFGRDVVVEHRGGRWSARARTAADPAPLVHDVQQPLRRQP